MQKCIQLKKSSDDSFLIQYLNVIQTQSNVALLQSSTSLVFDGVKDLRSRQLRRETTLKTFKRLNIMIRNQDLTIS